jgi:phosphoglycolate phosphatase-like HAD superfamily hydrolase
VGAIVIRGVIFDVDGTLVDRGKRRGEIFRKRYLPHVRAFPGARDLVSTLKEAGAKLAVASSAEKQELEPLLERAGAADLIEHQASSDDAESSKPDPDIVHAALQRLGQPRSDVVMSRCFSRDAPPPSDPLSPRRRARTRPRSSG